jgi:homoserine dehydrogenase
MLTLMEEGKTFDESVAYAQQIGIAESDPSGTSWVGTAVKVAALVTVLMDHDLTPAMVDRKGIDGLGRSRPGSRARGQALEAGVLRRKGAGGISAVGPELLAPDDPLHGVMGTSSALTFESDVLGPVDGDRDQPRPAQQPMDCWRI